jgi:hypothetical protein
MFRISSRRWRAQLCVIVLGLLGLVATSRGVVDGQPAPIWDRRYDAVALLFTVQPWATCGGWISGSCTLIAPNTVLLAKHSVQHSDQTLPADGERSIRVRFRRNAQGEANNHYGGAPADCQTAYQEIYIQRFIACPFVGVDVVLGLLESEPVGIEPIGVDITFPFDAGHSVILAGWGYDGRCIQTGDAWTLRTDRGVLPVQRFTSPYLFEYNQATFSGTCLNQTSSPLTGAHWVIGNTHDSGAPILIERPGENDPNTTVLRVVGVVTSFTTAQRITSWNLAGGQPPLQNPQARNACAEFDGIPGVTTNDVYEFIRAWLLGEPRADVDGQPGITLSDLLTYVQWFLGGC